MSLLLVYRGVDFLYNRYESKKILSQKDMSMYEYDKIKNVVTSVLSAYVIDKTNGEGVKGELRKKVSDEVWDELFPPDRDLSSLFTSYEIINLGVSKDIRKGSRKVLLDVVFKNGSYSYDVRLYMTYRGGIVTEIKSMGLKSNEL